MQKNIPFIKVKPRFLNRSALAFFVISFFIPSRVFADSIRLPSASYPACHSDDVFDLLPDIQAAPEKEIS
jgi:hypothetical protein